MLFNRLLLLLTFMGLCLGLTAQDSLERAEVLPPNAKHVVRDRSYSDADHYDKVTYMKEFPHTDTAAFKQMLSRYGSDDFSYDEVNNNDVNLFQRAIKRIKEWLSSLMPSSSFINGSDILYKVMAVVAILVFLLILYKLLFSGKRLLGPSEEEDKDLETIKFIEKNLLEVDLASFIEKAKQEQDYALAIRYLNLLNIQLLANKGLILWKPSKTNQELIGELKEEELRNDFKRNVAIFNRIWFSELALDATQYADYASYFLQFQARWR